MNFKQRFKNFIFKKLAKRNYTTTLSNEKINKILMIRDGGIGDAVCSYPLLRELKKNFPQAKIDIYASLNNHFMYKYVPYVNNVYLKYKKRQWFKSWFEIIKMRNNNYDLVIDDTVIRLHRTLYTMIINPKFAISSSDTSKRYGFDRSQLSYYFKTYDSNILLHIVDKRLKILTLLNIHSFSNKMEFFLPNKKNTQIQEKLALLKKYKLIALNTEGSSPSRTLNTKQIITLCQLLKDTDIKIIPFCLPNKFDYFKNMINENNLNNMELPYQTKTIYEAAEILNEVDLLITPDTSFVHIASGLNVPTIAIFWNNPMKYVEWGSKSDTAIAVTPEGKESNIKNIDLKTVQEKALNLLFN